MPGIRYALLLPLAHLAIAVPLVCLEEAKSWKFIPQMQTMEDADKAHPPNSQSTGSQVGWDPYYEYRPPTSVKAICAAELPAGLLVGWHRRPLGAGLLNHLLLDELTRFHVRTRIVVLDCILIATICAPWWLVGWWLDRLHLQRRPMGVVSVAAAVITGAGMVMALLSGSIGIREFIALISGFFALLGWLAIMLVAATTTCKIAFRKLLSS